MLSDKPRAIDLFCGCGGLSLGLERAGVDVRLGLDFDAHALETYRTNLGHPVLLQDVRDVTGKELLRAARVDELEILAGGPSCQGFSTHGKRLEDDPRNFLYREFVRLVEETMPRAVLIENVKGMLISGRGRFADEIRHRFNELGYTITGHLVLAADYGVPQRRERVFFIGSRHGTITPPPPSHGVRRPDTLPLREIAQHVSVDEALADLPLNGVDRHDEPVAYASPPTGGYQQAMRRGQSEVLNHVTKSPSDHALSIISKVRPGYGLRSVPPDELPERFQRMRRISDGSLRKDCTTLYGRLAPEVPSYTITCYFNNVSAGAFTHPYANRAISAREAARLQSFPDDFVFRGAYVARQIGNAVPPLLAEHFGRALVSHLKEMSEVPKGAVTRAA